MEKIKESVYRDICILKFNGVKEYHLPSGKIVDIFTRDYVMEVDFVHKWAEAIGQSLQYAMETNKTPCIVFIYDSVKDNALLTSIFPLLKRLCIHVYTIDYITHQIYLRIN